MASRIKAEEVEGFLESDIGLDVPILVQQDGKMIGIILEKDSDWVLVNTVRAQHTCKYHHGTRRQCIYDGFRLGYTFCIQMERKTCFG